MKTTATYFIPLYIILALGIQAAFFCPVIRAQGRLDGTATLDCPPPTSAGTPVTFTANISGGTGSQLLVWTLSAGAINNGQGTPSITVDTTGLGGQSVTATVQIGEAGQSRTLSCTWTVGQPSSPTSQKIDSGAQNQTENQAAENTETTSQPTEQTNQPTETTSQPEDTTSQASTESSSQVNEQASAANAELQGQASQLQDQLTQLQGQLNSATQGQADSLSPSARTDLQNQANQLQSQLEQLQSKLKTNAQGQTGDQASQANTKLQSQVSQLQDQLSQLQGKLTGPAKNPLDKVVSEKTKLPGKLGKLASLSGKLSGTLDKVNAKTTTKAQDKLNQVSTAANTPVQGTLDKVNAAVNTKATDAMSKVQNQTGNLQNQLSTANQPLASVEQRMQSLLSTAKPDAKPYLELAQQDVNTTQESLAAGKLQQGTQQAKGAIQTLIETSKNGLDTTDLQRSLVEGVEAKLSKAVAEREASVGSDNANVQKAHEALDQGHQLLEQGAFTKALDSFSVALRQLSAP